ncbi:hypothetical protein D3C72_1608000 [compost metagenome]
MAAYYAKPGARAACVAMPQAGARQVEWQVGAGGRRLANAYNTAHGKSTYLQAHVRARTLLAPRGRQLYRTRLGPRGRRRGVRTGRQGVSRPGHHAGTRRAGAPDLARDHPDQQARGLCVGPGGKGLYASGCADRLALALRRLPASATLRTRASGRAGRGRPAGYRFARPAGADARRPHRQAPDR